MPLTPITARRPVGLKMPEQSSLSVPHADCYRCSARRRLRPGARCAQAHRLEGRGNAQHAEIVEAAADDLQADRQALVAVPAIDRRRRLLRHVEGDRAADVRKGIERIFAWRGDLGRKRRDRRRRQDHEIVRLRRPDRRLAHREIWLKPWKMASPPKSAARFAPGADEGEEIFARRSGGVVRKSANARMRQKRSSPSSMSWARNGGSGSTTAPAAQRSRAAAPSAARVGADVG